MGEGMDDKKAVVPLQPNVSTGRQGEHDTTLYIIFRRSLGRSGCSGGWIGASNSTSEGILRRGSVTLSAVNLFTAYLNYASLSNCLCVLLRGSTKNEIYIDTSIR